MEDGTRILKEIQAVVWGLLEGIRSEGNRDANGGVMESTADSEIILDSTEENIEMTRLIHDIDLKDNTYFYYLFEAHESIFQIIRHLLCLLEQREPPEVSNILFHVIFVDSIS